MKAVKHQINKLKLKLSEHFSLKTSIKTLSNVIRNFYVISKRFDEINYGIENPKRFKVCLFLCITLWLAILWHLILLIPSVWSLINGPFMPLNFMQRLTALPIGMYCYDIASYEFGTFY